MRVLRSVRLYIILNDTLLRQRKQLKMCIYVQCFIISSENCIVQQKPSRNRFVALWLNHQTTVHVCGTTAFSSSLLVKGRLQSAVAAAFWTLIVGYVRCT